MTAARLRRTWAQHYSLGNAVLGVAGDISPDQLFDLVASIDKAASSGEQPREVRTPAVRFPRRPLTVATNRDREQSHFALLWPGCKIGDARLPKLDVLMAVLGGQAGRLFERLREREGLVYTVSASSVEGVDAGYLRVRGSTSHKTLSAAMEGVDDELNAIVAGGIGQEELERAKAWLVGQHEVELQRRSRIAAHLAFDQVFGRPLGDFSSYPARVLSVSRRDVIRLADVLFRQQPRVASVVHPR